MNQVLATVATVYVAFVLAGTDVAADPRGVEPRWLLLAAVQLLWSQRISHAVLWGGLCGLLSDVLAGRPLGVGVAVVSLAVWCFGWLRRDRRWSSGVAFLIATFAFTSLCVVALTGLTAALSGSALPEPRRLLLLAGGQGAMTALWGGVLYLAARIVSGLVRRIVPPLDWRKASD